MLLGLGIGCVSEIVGAFGGRNARRISRRGPHIDPFIHMRTSTTLSRRTVGISEADELKDITRLLASLWEAAQRLPEGSERQHALRQIGSFHRRVAAKLHAPSRLYGTFIAFDIEQVATDPARTGRLRLGSRRNWQDWHYAMGLSMPPIGALVQRLG
jgi:hypothetical protein